MSSIDHLLKETLLDEKFYLNSMSMFLKDSFGMIDREHTYYAALKNLDDISLGIFSRLDIYNCMFDQDYFVRNCPEGYDAATYRTMTEDAFLDLLGNIFGISRTLNVKYTDPISHQAVEETITLNNREYLIYIQVVITRLNYKGTAQEIENLYYAKPGVNPTEIQKLKIYYTTSTTQPLCCNVYMCNPEDIGGNIYKLFLSDNLLIESLGITYNKHIGITTFPVQFDVPAQADIQNHSYVFDPDFSHNMDNGFMYGVFVDGENEIPTPPTPVENVDAEFDNNTQEAFSPPYVFYRG